MTSTGEVDRFLSDDPFVADYGVDITDVPASIRPIPLLAHVAPVAWATGATITVDSVDAAFLASLRRIRTTLCQMYPSFMEGGAIDCPNPVERESGQRGEGRSAMLFTGGVDSMATYVRHRAEEPDLISVKGWVIRESERERWTKNREFFEEFADERGLTNHFVQSNMLEFLRTPLLQAHFQRYLDGAWYSSVGHGLGLLGLCAPLTAAADIETLYIAATHTEEWTRPWGSHPDIDDHIEWAGTRAVHDGYDWTRQDKIEAIADYADHDDRTFRLRTCTHSETPANCNECEKCYRTIVGLLLAGVDPNDFGYEYDGSTPTSISDGFESGTWVLSPDKKYYWGELKERAGSIDSIDGPAGKRLLEWLLDADFEQYVDSAGRALRYRLVQSAVRNTPTTVFSTLYPIYKSASST